MDDNAIDKVITGCIAAGLGSIMLCSFVIPVVSTMLNSLTGDSVSGFKAEDVLTWKTLIALVVMMTIIGLIIAIVRGFALRNR
jgi:hypothetical protein